MESKLLEFKKKNSDLDTTKPQENIDYLKQVQTKFHYLWHENYKQLQLTGAELLERQRFLNKIGALEKEIKTLKENIFLK
jgi:hypothetical protein